MVHSIGYEFYKIKDILSFTRIIFEKEVQDNSWVTLSEKFVHADGSFLSTLKIGSAKLEDSGKYICVVFRKGEKYFR